jgi:hypothetical protein
MKNLARLTAMLFFLVCAAFPLIVLGQQDEIREWEMRRDALNKLGESRNRPAPRGRGLIIPQHNRDFRRIQVLNDQLRQATVQSDVLDLEFVAKSASEINKCAKRLRYGLALQKSDVSAKVPSTEVKTEHDQVRSSLKALGELIAAFVNNPAFKDSRIVNAKSWVNVGRELDEIIELSSELKKSSSKLASRESGKK